MSNVPLQFGDGNPERIKVLMYHRIVEDPALSRSNPMTCVTARAFRRHLDLLERWGFTAITFEDYRLFLQGELNLPKRPVILTFDDGYRDVYDNAFPLLQEFGMKAVMFVMGDRNLGFNKWDSTNGHPVASLMDNQQLLELHASGMEIGSHSMTHARLSLVPLEKAWEEISRSRMTLEILLNSPVRTFAYPHGMLDPDTRQMTEDAGYTIGCATYSGPPRFGTDPFTVRRIAITDSVGTVGLALRMLTPFEYYSWVRWQTRRAVGGHRIPPRPPGDGNRHEDVKTYDLAE